MGKGLTQAALRVEPVVYSAPLSGCQPYGFTPREPLRRIVGGFEKFDQKDPEEAKRDEEWDKFLEQCWRSLHPNIDTGSEIVPKDFDTKQVKSA